MRELPQGTYYVCRDGDHTRALDHRGNVYAIEAAYPPPATMETPARVASPKKRPPSPLPDATARYLDGITLALTKEPREHFIAIGLTESGGIAFEHQESSGAWNHCDVNLKAILTQLERTGTRGLMCYHNHPDGSREMSDEDRDLTERLKAALSAYDVSLLKHHIVPGDVELIESRPRTFATCWDRAEAERERLWSAYGGHPPSVPGRQ
jgi:DNA repair protein RadC